MKHLTISIILLLSVSCSQKTENTQQLENRINQLEKQVTNSYKPGLGEMMSSMQAHHAKLWFAGKNKNWQLANFEVKELHEIIEDIKIFQKDRAETNKIEMINPSLKNLEKAVSQKNITNFNIGFQQLTTNCNKCHQLTDFGYNKVIVPKTSPFTNQEFELK